MPDQVPPAEDCYRRGDHGQRRRDANECLMGKEIVF